MEGFNWGDWDAVCTSALYLTSFKLVGGQIKVTMVTVFTLWWDGSVPLCQEIECNVDCVYANPKGNKLLTNWSAWRTQHSWVKRWALIEFNFYLSRFCKKNFINTVAVFKMNALHVSRYMWKQTLGCVWSVCGLHVLATESRWIYTCWCLPLIFLIPCHSATNLI